MPSTDTTSWINVKDFTPGIRQLTNQKTIQPFSPHPQGVAAATNANGTPATFGCVALPEGGIGPVPFAFSTASLGPAANPDNAQRVSSWYGVCGLHIPQHPIVDQAQSAPTDSCLVYTGLTYQALVAAGSPLYDNVKYRIYQLSMAAAIPSLAEILGTAATTPAFDLHVPSNGTAVNNLGYIPMCDYRSSSPGPATSPGTPLVIFAIADPCFGNRQSGTFNFGFSTFQLLAYTTATGGISVYWIISHQGRLVINGSLNDFIWGRPPVAAAAFHSVSNDETWWTLPNQDALDNNAISSAFSQQVLGSYGAMTSSTANEMLMIRATSHGGLTVSSDLNDPIVTDYPAIQGTNGCLVEGCWTPIGYVYGARNGSVYAYPGGGRSVDLAPSMDNGFWHQNLVATIGQGNSFGAAPPQTMPISLPHFGKFAYMSGYIFCPGNWLYDIDHNSWWRFETTPDPVNTADTFNHHWFATSPLGQVYSAPARWLQGQTLVANAKFRDNTGPPLWQWTSQPIPISKDSQNNEVREFVLHALSTSVASTAVNVTLTAYPSGDTIALPSAAFTNVGTPQAFRWQLPSLQGTHVVVRLLSTGLSTTIPCPIVESFDLGIAELNMIPAS